MSTENENSGPPTKEEIKASLEEAIKTDPGLVRTVVEELAIERQAQRAAEEKITQPKFTSNQLQQQIMVKSPDEADTICKFLDQFEGDAMMRAKDGGWLYVRRRAMLAPAEEDKKDEEPTDSKTSETILGPDGTPAEKAPEGDGPAEGDKVPDGVGGSKPEVPEGEEKKDE